MTAAESAASRALDELDQALLRELRGNGLEWGRRSRPVTSGWVRWSSPG